MIRHVGHVKARLYSSLAPLPALVKPAQGSLPMLARTSSWLPVALTDYRPSLMASPRTFPSIKVLLLTMDVRNRSQVFDAIKHLPVGFRGIDVLVNSAGLVVGVDQLDKVTPEAIDSMFDTNVKGLMNVTQAVLPIMKERNSGCIINVSSISGTQVYPGRRVDPGLVETEFSMMRFGGDKDKTAAPYKGLIPLTGQDIAESIVFIASRRPHVQISHMQILPTSQASVTLINREQQ
ncbi:hypothetical protein BASA83_001396 [Batrachochytrium salamandrivorans]|nr:hypothetical protein BASA83_001396 [Batrachochytrium salamandrivorans]